MRVALNVSALGLRALIAGGCMFLADAASAQRVWTTPVTITPALQQSTLPQLAMDGSGNAVATWIGGQVSGPTLRITRAARLTATGLWGHSQDLYSPVATAVVPSETSDVALNTGGRGAAVWVRAIGTGPADQIVQGAIFDGVGWGLATNLMPAGAATTRSPRLGVDADGNAVAAWVQALGGITVVRAARYQVGGAWSAPATISGANEDVAGDVAFGVDDTGNAVAVWAAATGGLFSLRAAQFDEGTGLWSTATTVAPAGRSPSLVKLVVNRAGTAAFVAYRAFDGAHDIVRAARLEPASGAWAAPVDVSSSGQHVSELDVAADEEGGAVAVWNRFDGTYRTVQTARYTGVWSAPSDRTSGADTADVSVDTDAVGNATAAWTALDGAVHRVQASAFSATTATWTPAADVSDTDGDAAAPRVRLYSDGTAAVVWRSEASDLFSIRASRYALSVAPVLAPAAVGRPSVTLSWTPGTGAAPSGYTVVASMTPGGPVALVYSVGWQTSLVLNARDGAYYVRVLAHIGGGTVSSNEIEVIVGSGAAPTAPRNLTAVVNGNTFTMTWAPPANVLTAPVTTYYVGAGTAGGISDLAFFPTGRTQTSFDTPALPDGTYWVRVHALSAGGLGPPTPDLRVAIGPLAPGAPVLSGGATGPGTVLMQWTAPAEPGAQVTGYQLRAGYLPGQSDAAVFTFPASTLSYGASAIPPGTYYVRVAALSSSGPGAVSSEVVVTVP
jgi:Fibronectin type III domain